MKRPTAVVTPTSATYIGLFAGAAGIELSIANTNNSTTFGSGDVASLTGGTQNNTPLYQIKYTTTKKW